MRVAQMCNHESAQPKNGSRNESRKPAPQNAVNVTIGEEAGGNECGHHEQIPTAEVREDPSQWIPGHCCGIGHHRKASEYKPVPQYFFRMKIRKKVIESVGADREGFSVEDYG